MFSKLNLCSLKKKRGEPVGTNISTIINLFMPRIIILTRVFYRTLAFKALLLYYWNAAFGHCFLLLQLTLTWVR